MNLKEIKELIALMNEHHLGEIEIEREGTKIRLCKEGAGPSRGVVVERVGVPEAAAAPAPAPEAQPTGTEIKSPMVGTFYRAPAPEAPPFVETGQQVEVGQVLCIIEAMKLMNEFKSEVKGRIVKILPDNAQPVEFGQPLFVVEPT